MLTFTAPSVPKFLTYEHITAGPTYNRWLFPPAALLIHFSIGSAYSYSVFNKPLTKLCKPGVCEDWNLVQVGWVFTLFFIFLGSSAAVLGRFLERRGPRLSGLIASICWGFGYMIASYAVKIHNLPLLYIGNGVIGGIGLGCGYISPVSTLMKWFPDRRGMATGLAIGGFGGGAVIGAPLGQLLLSKYGVSHAFLMLGIGYMCAMLVGAFSYRVPPQGWKPAGWEPPAPEVAKDNSSKGYMDANKAIFTIQFWLLWLILCTNVTCGIAMLGQLSVIVQDIFSKPPAVAAGVVGLASICNIGGRLFWSTISDKTGRWVVYSTFYVCGMVLYGILPLTGRAQNFSAFLACLGVCLTFYGGGFAAIPAYISDIFGIKFAGAIHGRVLTAWSVAAVVGPYMLNSIREAERRAGHPVATGYDRTLHILVFILAIGLAANIAVPFANKYFPVKLTMYAAAEGEVSEAVNVASVEEGQQAQTDEVEGKEIELVETGKATQVPAYAPQVKKADDPHSQAPAWMVPIIAAWWAVPLTAFGWGMYEVVLKAMQAF